MEVIAELAATWQYFSSISLSSLQILAISRELPTAMSRSHLSGFGLLCATVDVIARLEFVALYRHPDPSMVMDEQEDPGIE